MILSFAQLLEIDESGGIGSKQFEVLPIQLHSNNQSLDRLGISLSAIKLGCCVGWLFVWGIKFAFRHILFECNLPKLSMFFLEPVLIALTVLSVAIDLKLN
jgi:hypothetical protein